jgi:hypothetical protein
MDLKYGKANFTNPEFIACSARMKAKDFISWLQ